MCRNGQYDYWVRLRFSSRKSSNLRHAQWTFSSESASHLNVGCLDVGGLPCFSASSVRSVILLDGARSQQTRTRSFLGTIQVTWTRHPQTRHRERRPCAG